MPNEIIEYRPTVTGTGRSRPFWLRLWDRTLTGSATWRRTSSSTMTRVTTYTRTSSSLWLWTQTRATKGQD